MIRKLGSEILSYLPIMIYFILFFLALSAYRRLLLGESALDVESSGFGVMQALILTKIIALGQHFKLGERFAEKPLWIPTLYKTLLFSLLVALFTVIEYFFDGLYHEKTWIGLYQKMVQEDWQKVGGKIFVMFFSFILLFAFLELGRVLGKNRLLNLFFKRRDI